MKPELRQQARKNLESDKICDARAGALLKNNFLKNIELPPSSVISAYWPIGSEIDVRPLLTALYDAGHTICLPVMVAHDQPLKFLEWTPDAVLHKSKFGIWEPCAKQHEEVTPGVMIVPLLAFDERRHRLGYGGGYYDRTIAALKPMTIGVAYGAQEIEAVPDEEWDVALDKIVTENKVF